MSMGHTAKSTVQQCFFNMAHEHRPCSGCMHTLPVITTHHHACLWAGFMGHEHRQCVPGSRNITMQNGINVINNYQVIGNFH